VHRSVFPKAFRSALAAIAAFSVLQPLAASAVEGSKFPQRPVRWVVPFPAGGSVDLVGRLIGQKLFDVWGQQLVIDNRPAAGGRLGTQIAAQAAPEGYTQLLTLNTNLTADRSLFKSLPYDPDKAFVPITITAGTSQLLVVNPALPAQNVKELIAMCRQKPGQLNYGSSGVGGSLHLAMELFKSMAGIEVTHVAYKGGPPAALDLVAGQINMMFFNTPAALTYVKSGRLRALGVSTAKRSPQLPDVPTIAEAGVPGYDASVWFGLAAPTGTAPAIIDKTYRDIARVLAMPDVRQALQGLGAEAIGSTPQEMARRTRAETQQWARVVTRAKISFE
jgi:tripartite-type tricarboxylate transporter receptor subunit TctC